MDADLPSPIALPALNDRRTINGWAIFDWANSSYALVISSAIFPAYYTQVTDDWIHIGPVTMSNSGLYAYALSASYILIAMWSPILSGIADASGRKKFFLRIFTTLGAISCLSLALFKGMDQLWTGVVGFMGATIGFTGALVFYNAYLPEIATEDRFDRVSARGFAFGYVGSVILLILNLLVIMNHEVIGLDQGEATRLAFISVGLWWFGFAQITFARLPADRALKFPSGTFRRGFRELAAVWRQVKHMPNLKRFLISFFFYSAGVQTVLYLAATFAEKELHFETTNLILLILVLQLVAIVGAYAFAILSERIGNKASLFAMLTIWITVCITAYVTYTQGQFYVIAAFVGLVMGGIQSLSRSTYSKLVPAETPDRTSYFSFYDILEKVAIVVGTFSWGTIEQLTGGMRPSILALIVFFVIGMALLSRVRIAHARPEA